MATYPSIGNSVVTAFDGRLRRARRGVAMLETAAGVDGDAVVVGSWHNTPERVRTYVEVTGAYTAADTRYELYRAMIGTTVTVVDQFNQTWSNVVVMDVVPEISAKVGFANTWCIEARWLLLPPVDTP